MNELCVPLEILFNKSLKASVITSICKKAIIIPIYKGKTTRYCLRTCPLSNNDV